MSPPTTPAHGGTADADSEASNQKSKSKFAQGDWVEVIVPLHTNSVPAVLLRVRETGIVLEIDKDGDALVGFEGLAENEWVKKNQFKRLRKARNPKGSPEDSPGSSEDCPEESPGGSSSQMTRFGSSDGSTCETINTDSSNGVEEITTLMIRNMPCRLKQSDVVSELDFYGFGGTYDWLYMPSNLTVASKGKGQGKGYAFVNFIKPEFATRFKEEWHRARRWRMSRRSVLDISVAVVQGKEKNIEQFMRGKTSRILSCSFRPFEPESLFTSIENDVQSALM